MRPILWCSFVAVALLACAEGKPLDFDAGVGSAAGDEPPAADASPPEVCACSSGECCDGCNLLPDTTQCGVDPVDVDYDCDGAACGADALTREQFQYCNGATTDCGMGNLVWHDWTLLQDCGADALCQADAEGAACSTCDSGCSDGACVCGQGGNVAQSATASINRGSSSPATYGPQIMNDGSGEASCGFSWFYDAAPDIGWMELEWSTPQDLWGFTVDTVSSVSAPCAYTASRTLTGGSVQWWDGGAWVTDGTITGQTNDWTYVFTAPVTTTRIRIYDAYSSPNSNPVVFEWQAFACTGN